MREIILIHATGEDRPGITSILTGVLAACGVDILDIGQVVIHDHLTLGMLVALPGGTHSAPVLKDLLFKAHESGIALKLTPVSPAEYETWVGVQGKPRHMVTLLARSLEAAQLSRVADTLARHGLNIDIINRLSGRVSLIEAGPVRPACVEFSVRGSTTDWAAIRREFMDISSEMGVDIALQEDNVFRRNRRLVAFDMDSTLIQVEVIDELAKRFGVGDEVSAITAGAMRGEYDFKESLRRRLSLLKGLDAKVLEEVAATLPLTEGAERLISNLKRLGFKIAIISGGFTYFGERLKQRLGIDYVFANKLEVKEGRLTGRVTGPIVDGARKAELLRRLADKEGIDLQQVIAVGDGANDLPMLGIAGLGIAFHAKPKVKAGARQSISTLGLDAILYLIGFRERETLG
ncbi:MAG: phosphoserine phosphatase SerB [Deltaproteobacteria bacterium HGW-Deltaproteobacteria-8]|jgi:phosphoserine phosphatase|nr:MAG: phosphoserine phosphatase SerB [Deltaproteobacteria bacterium HGW-Deltaproteobacteria-8]